MSAFQRASPSLEWIVDWSLLYLTIAGSSSSWLKENRRYYVPSSKKTRSSSERVAMRLCLFYFCLVAAAWCECGNRFLWVLRSDHAIMMSHIRITENTSNWTTSLKSWYRNSLNRKLRPGFMSPRDWAPHPNPCFHKNRWTPQPRWGHCYLRSSVNTGRPWRPWS